MTQTTEELTKDERDKRLRKAYSSATTRLREAHRTEFDSLYSQCAEELGVTYTPKPTAEQKAEQQLQELLEAHPHLADKIIEERSAEAASYAEDEEQATNI